MSTEQKPRIPEDFDDHCRYLTHLIDDVTEDVEKRAEIFQAIKTLVDNMGADGPWAPYCVGWVRNIPDSLEGWDLEEN